MVDFKALLPGHKQTQAEGGSSYTHPLAQPPDQHNPPHGSSGPAAGTGLSSDPADAAMTRQGAAVSGDDRQQRLVGDEALTSEGLQNVYGAKPDNAVGATQRPGSERSGGATGLETRNPYAAAAQAGALPDKQDIQKISAETALGRVTREPGFAAAESAASYDSGRDTQDTAPAHGLNAGTDDSVAVNGRAPISAPVRPDPDLDQGGNFATADSSAPYTSSSEMNRAAPAHGLNAGTDDPVAVSGRAPISEPVRPDADLDPYAGQATRSMGGGIEGSSGSNKLGGQEWLIHGHHTTMTGEALDPHLSSDHSQGRRRVSDGGMICPVTLAPDIADELDCGANESMSFAGFVYVDKCRPLLRIRGHRLRAYMFADISLCFLTNLSPAPVAVVRLGLLFR